MTSVLDREGVDYHPQEKKMDLNTKVCIAGFILLGIMVGVLVYYNLTEVYHVL